MSSLSVWRLTLSRRDFERSSVLATVRSVVGKSSLFPTAMYGWNAAVS
jgi:hypothetical protein